MAENTGRMSAMPKVKIDDVDDMEERLKQRKNEIISVRDSLACIDWQKIKMSSVGENVLVEQMVEAQPNCNHSVRISTNFEVDIMSKKTEGLLENFHGDLLKLKRRFNWATVLELEDVDEEGKIAETMMIIQQMDDWVSQSIDKLVTYLVSRTQMLSQGKNNFIFATHFIRMIQVVC